MMDIAECIELIRKKPGVYVGGRDGQAVAHMLWEIVANSLDEHMAGRCSRISLEVTADGAIVVEDNGRGIPVEKTDGLPYLERIFTTIHHTPTRDGHAPHEHLTAWGVGLLPICALCASVDVRVQRDGRIWTQRFARGVATSRLRQSGKADQTGTRIVFIPDPAIFKNLPDPGIILERLKELSYCLPKLTIHFADRREHVLHEPRGVLAHLDSLTPVPDPDPKAISFSASGTVDQIAVEVAARWSTWNRPRIESFANILRLSEGGTPTRGLLLGLAAGLKNAAPRACAKLGSVSIARVLSRHLIAVVRVRLDAPRYDRPTRDRLITPEAKSAVKKVVSSAFAQFLEQEPPVLQFLVSELRLN